MLKYSRILTDEEERILSYDLLDIQKWIDGMIDGKINNCMKRAAQDYREILKREGADMLPASDKLAAKTLFERKTYKNRQERENGN